jgi:hypothetical protein
MRTGLAVAAAVGMLWASGGRAQAPAAVPGGPDVLRSVFPEAERFDSDDVLLTPEMAKRLDDLARSTPCSSPTWCGPSERRSWWPSSRTAA